MTSLGDVRLRAEERREFQKLIRELIELKAPSASTRANDDAYQSTIFSPVTWAAIAFAKSS